VSKVAQRAWCNQQQNDALSKLPSIISVAGAWFRRQQRQASWGAVAMATIPNSPVQVLGAGHLSDARKQSLTENERKRLAE
jgi:hypothetical protein